MDAASLHDRQNLEVKEEITLKGAGCRTSSLSLHPNVAIASFLV